MSHASCHPRARSSGSEVEAERFEYESSPTQRCVFAHVATHRRATLPAEEKPTLHTLEKSYIVIQDKCCVYTMKGGVRGVAMEHHHCEPSLTLA